MTDRIPRINEDDAGPPRGTAADGRVTDRSAEDADLPPIITPDDLGNSEDPDLARVDPMVHGGNM